jgi:hypothetical protein
MATSELTYVYTNRVGLQRTLREIRLHHDRQEASDLILRRLVGKVSGADIALCGAWAHNRLLVKLRMSRWRRI